MKNLITLLGITLITMKCGASLQTTTVFTTAEKTTVAASHGSGAFSEAGRYTTQPKGASALLMSHPVAVLNRPGMDDTGIKSPTPIKKSYQQPAPSTTLGLIITKTGPLVAMLSIAMVIALYGFSQCCKH